jgi:hypothetical protein
MLPLCDREDRLAARIYSALRVDCDCCTFWRGVVLGLVVGAIAAALVCGGIK